MCVVYCEQDSSIHQETNFLAAFGSNDKVLIGISWSSFLSVKYDSLFIHALYSAGQKLGIPDKSFNI